MGVKITFQDKVGVEPKQIHKHQVWDDDINAFKQAINQNDKEIDSMYVYNANGETEWIVGHRFSGWIGDRFVAGKVKQIPFDPVTDIDNASKTTLAVDSWKTSDWININAVDANNQNIDKSGLYVYGQKNGINNDNSIFGWKVKPNTPNPTSDSDFENEIGVQN